MRKWGQPSSRHSATKVDFGGKCPFKLGQKGEIGGKWPNICWNGMGIWQKGLGQAQIRCHFHPPSIHLRLFRIPRKFPSPNFRSFWTYSSVQLLIVSFMYFIWQSFQIKTQFPPSESLMILFFALNIPLPKFFISTKLPPFFISQNIFGLISGKIKPNFHLN